jgi:holin (3TMs family)
MGLTVQDIIGGTFLDSLKGLIGEFHLSKEDQAKFSEAIDANKTVIDAKQIEYQEKLEDSYQTELNTASANIRAEMATGDKFTVRARPSYIYWCELILGVNFILFPLLGKTPVNFPDALYWLFGTCILGYTGARSWDKRTLMNSTGTN